MALPRNPNAWTAALPKLKLDPNDPVSQHTGGYNCIAYAAGDTTRWWDNDHYWPPNVPKDWSVDGVQRAFATESYEACPDGDVEAGFEKVSIYADAAGRLTHAARQLDDGRWTSKCGREEDIIHSTPQCLSSTDYGDPVAYMKRPIKTQP